MNKATTTIFGRSIGNRVPCPFCLGTLFPGNPEDSGVCQACLDGYVTKKEAKRLKKEYDLDDA